MGVRHVFVYELGSFVWDSAGVGLNFRFVSISSLSSSLYFLYFFSHSVSLYLGSSRLFILDLFVFFRLQLFFFSFFGFLCSSTSGCAGCEDTAKDTRMQHAKSRGFNCCEWQIELPEKHFTIDLHSKEFANKHIAKTLSLLPSLFLNIFDTLHPKFPTRLKLGSTFCAST